MSNLLIPEWISLIRKSFASVGVIVKQRPVLNFNNHFTLTDDQRNGRTNLALSIGFLSSSLTISPGSGLKVDVGAGPGGSDAVLVDDTYVPYLSGATYTGQVNANVFKAPQITGSLQRLTTGQTYLAGVGGITITTASNGQVLVSGSMDTTAAGLGLTKTGNIISVNDNVVPFLSGATFSGAIVAPSVVANFTGSITGAIASFNRINLPAQASPDPVPALGVALFASSSRPTFVDQRGGKTTVFAPVRSDITANEQHLSVATANDWYCNSANFATGTFNSYLDTTSAQSGSIISIANFSSSFRMQIIRNSNQIIWFSAIGANELADFVFDGTTWQGPVGLKRFM